MNKTDAVCDSNSCDTCVGDVGDVGVLCVESALGRGHEEEPAGLHGDQGRSIGFLSPFYVLRMSCAWHAWVNMGKSVAEVYYQEITVSNFDSIKRLKEDS